MALQKIIKYVKVAATSKAFLTSCAAAGVAGVASAIDADSFLPLVTGAATVMAGTSMIAQKTYKDVREHCEYLGFTEGIMGNGSLRKMARMYAIDENKECDFERALNHYREKA